MVRWLGLEGWKDGCMDGYKLQYEVSRTLDVELTKLKHTQKPICDIIKIKHVSKIIE